VGLRPPEPAFPLVRKATRSLKTSLVRARPLGQAAVWVRSAAAPRLATIRHTHRPGRCRPLLWARRGAARTGVLAYLVAWVIPGEGQKGSIAENIAGKKHDAWSG
jgi:hypothetical protein